MRRGRGRAASRALGHDDQQRLDEYLTSVRDLERSIASLPPEYGTVVERAAGRRRPEGLAAHREAADATCWCTRWPRGQTRVASYMLTKCQGLSRFPWLGYTAQRHHEYTHGSVETPEGQRILRDICRWHVEEFAYLLAKLKSIPEGDGTLLDHTLLVYVHEHAEANSHKTSGLRP